MSDHLAPPSASTSAFSLSVPKPAELVAVPSESTDQAIQRRLARKPSLLARLRDSKRKSKRLSTQDLPEDAAQPPIAISEPCADTSPIHLGSTVSLAFAAQTVQDGDRYEWAVVYENQRGITLFSTPYYSSLGLLPTDPSPFTLPNASKRRSEQPPITLQNYSLPDGSWQWVSRCWMIDMRSDSGEVAHDGWEYNTWFRKHGWKGTMGGWVRRRRWIRLMVRMGPHKHHNKEVSPLGSSSVASYRLSQPGSRQSVGSGLQLSLVSGSSGSASRWQDMNPDDVWLGDSVDEDWERCHLFLKRFGRDGRKLELWRLWLGYYHPDHRDLFTVGDLQGKRREKQWTEDEGPLPSEMAELEVFSQKTVALAPREYLIPVLRKYGDRILKTFIYPDSKAEFIKLLALSGLLQEVNIPYQNPLQAADLDFYSYTNSFTVEAPKAS